MSKTLLEELGITREEVMDRIVAQALGSVANYRQTGEETWEDIPLSADVDKRINQAVVALMKSMESHIHARVEEHLRVELQKTFEAPFQRVNSIGEPVGEPTTVREMIVEYAKNYWNEKVDSQGKPGSHYGRNQTRAEWQAGQVIVSTYENLLRDSVSTMVADLKKQMPDTLAQELSKSILATMFRR